MRHQAVAAYRNHARQLYDPLPPALGSLSASAADPNFVVFKGVTGSCIARSMFLLSFLTFLCRFQTFPTFYE